jgi:hypothetical protein
MSITKTIQFVKEDGVYRIYMAGESDGGIKVTGDTPEEVIEALTPYLYDALDEAAEEDD